MVEDVAGTPDGRDTTGTEVDGAAAETDVAESAAGICCRLSGATEALLVEISAGMGAAPGATTGATTGSELALGARAGEETVGLLT